MPTTLDFNFREALPYLHGGARLNVLVALLLRANVRNRCWPSMRRLAKDTGYALAAVNDAKKWLEEHGAIEIVKYEHRVGDEKKGINHLQNVYQLTGVITLEGKTYRYIYVPQIETSENETSIRETEVVTSLKSLQKKQTKQVVVVPEHAAESTDVPLKAEQPQPTPLDVLREGTDDEQPPTDTSLSKVPPKVLSQTAEALVTTLSKAKASRQLAVELMDT